MTKEQLNNISFDGCDVKSFEDSIRTNSLLYANYSRFSPDWKQKIVDFISGRKSLPIMYDATFKFVFNPETHRERLADLVSSIIGESIEILEILPNESPYIEGKILVVMDILVRLSDGSIANVEIQKNPYDFAGQRIACYTSDLILRQYSKLKSDLGSSFKYSDMNKIYTIVLYEKTDANFHKYSNQYLHKGKPQFDNDLKLDFIQEYYLIALDIFEKNSYDLINNHYDISDFVNNRLNGWLLFLITDKTEQIDKAIELFPWLKDIYAEIAYYRTNIGGVIDMYSQMIAELDYNSIKYIVDEQKSEIEQQKAQLEEKDNIIAEQGTLLAEKSILLTEKSILLTEKDNHILELSDRIKQLEALIDLYQV